MNEALNENQELPVKSQRATADNGGYGGDTVESVHSLERLREPKAAIDTAAVKPPQDRPAPLFSPDESQKFRAEWDAAQTGFVDEPRKSVEQADNLVAGVIKRLAEIFADERAKLEGQWESGDNISTEDLRLALQRYRSFFTRLLSV